MDTFYAIMLTIIISASGGYLAGWVSAHSEVATECQRQGSFYVGKADFVCSSKEK